MVFMVFAIVDFNMDVKKKSGGRALENVHYM
jgi:hypothetical protein